MFPNLIHPISVTVVRISKATTIYDADSREPITQANRTTPITLPGQIRFRRLDQVSMERGGDRLEARGYILFRKVDMDAQGIEIGINDKIVKIGHQTVEFFVVEREWLGHYQRHNGPSLLRAWFSDRRPSKQSGV